MNYARDIPPELNKLYDWLGGTLLRINRFKCDKTKRVCYSMLRTHLEKLTTLTIGFSGAVIEFRKELVGEREVAYAQAFIVLEQTRIATTVGDQSNMKPGDGLTELLKKNLERQRTGT
jgi:hypothetical protein